MSKLNTKIIPLSYEGYVSLTESSPKTDKAVQCDTVNNMDVLRETKWKLRGQRLLHHMRENDMNWDHLGRLVLGSQTVADSNLSNIIKDVCSDEDTSIGSRHSRDFFKLLTLTKFDPKYGELDQ